MVRRYRAQYAKLILLVQNQFLPILSSEGASAYASKTRLKTVVEKALERNFNLEMPKGAQIEQRNDFES